MSPVELLADLVKIDTTNPPGNEGPCAEILDAYLSTAGLKTQILKSPEGRPNLVARLEGRADRSPLVLVSHTDVVAVETEQWTHDPFGAEIADGSIWGRGVLDMKGIAVMHAAAAAAVAANGTAPERDVIVVAVADEEAGGTEGAEWLCRGHADLVGLRDGGPAPEVVGEGGYGLSGILERPLMPIVLGEKSVLWLDLVATGDPGHGALPPIEQAPHNLARAIDKVAGFGPPRVHPVMREQFEVLGREASSPTSYVFQLLASGVGRGFATALKGQLRSRGAIATLLSDTVTPTQMHAGYKHNVVPGSATASLDCRLLPDTDSVSFAESIRKKVSALGVEVREVAKHGGPVSDRGVLYETLVAESAALPSQPVVVPSLTSAMTDIRFWRQRGGRGYGWVPLVLTPELLATVHGHDERVPVEDFERAVETMTRVIKRAATT